MTNTAMTFENKRLVGIVAAIFYLLLIPVAAKFPWSGFDFFLAAVVLFGTGLAVELALRFVTNVWARIAVCGVILLALFLVWAELAVGLFGTRFAGN
jgi:hypothetical protein